MENQKIEMNLELKNRLNKLINNIVEIGRVVTLPSSKYNHKFKLEKVFEKGIDKWKVKYGVDMKERKTLCEGGVKFDLDIIAMTERLKNLRNRDRIYNLIEVGEITYNITSNRSKKQLNIHFKYNDELNEVLRFFYSHTFKFNNEEKVIKSFNIPHIIRELESGVLEFDKNLNEVIHNKFSNRIIKHIGFNPNNIEVKLYSQFRGMHNHLLREGIIRSGMRYKNFLINFGKMVNGSEYNKNLLYGRLDDLGFDAISKLIKYQQPYKELEIISESEMGWREKVNILNLKNVA